MCLVPLIKSKRSLVPLAKKNESAQPAFVSLTAQRSCSLVILVLHYRLQSEFILKWFGAQNFSKACVYE